MSEQQWQNSTPRWKTPARYTIKIGKGHFTGSVMVHRLIYGRRGPVVDQTWVGITWEAALDLVAENIRIDRLIQVHGWGES